MRHRGAKVGANVSAVSMPRIGLHRIFAKAEIWRPKLVALEEAMNGRGSVRGLPSDCADSRGFQTGIGRNADGRMSDLFEVAMVARGRENLIFNDARVWRGTNPSIVLEFLDFRAWPASRPTQILERRLRPLCLERPKAKEDWPKHRCAPGITRVAPAAECAPPRTRHRPQARGAGNSHFSRENFVGDLRANGCSQRASNPVDGEYDSNPNGMTAEQFRYASTTNRANRSAIAASSLAGRADFQDRTKLTQAAMELQLRSKARGTARKRGRPRTARRAAHHGSNLAIPAPLLAHSTSSQARHEHHFQLGRRRVDRRE